MIDARIKNFFFDRERVIKSVDAATRRVLSKFGAFVRTRAKSSIRSRKRIALPGEPPSSHEGSLKKFIYFGYDEGKKSVIIGPTPLNGLGKHDGPDALEHGGTVVRRERGKARILHYRGNPFMQPAFEREKKGLPALWANSVK